MSRSTIKAIWFNEKIEDFQELHNAWGTAPIIWDFMSEKYLGKKGWISYSDNQLLWDLWKNISIPKHHRALHMWTFDRGCIKKNDYRRFANDIWAFMKDCTIPMNQVNHWPAIAKIFESNPDIPAFGLWCTSVSSDPFEGEWDDEKEERKPFDWNLLWDVYEYVDSVTNQ